MYVVRPKPILGTPAAIARALGWRSRYYPNPESNRVYDFTRDFLMFPVEPRHLRNAPTEYNQTFAFAQRNKHGQRRALQEAGIPVPRVAGSFAESETLAGREFVVRPLRHSGGRGYRVTSDRRDFAPGSEYISELYPKKREYRIIFVRGEPLIYLRKKPNEGVGAEAPWGHENSRFQTIDDVPNSRIGGTDCAARLAALDIVRGAHIVAADILYNPQHQNPWVCLELNFCPGIDIDTNRDRVVEYIRSGRRASLDGRDISIGRVVVTPPPPPNPRIREIAERLSSLNRQRTLAEAEYRDAQATVNEIARTLSTLNLERQELERERATL